MWNQCPGMASLPGQAAPSLPPSLLGFRKMLNRVISPGFILLPFPMLLFLLVGFAVFLRVVCVMLLFIANHTVDFFIV